MGTMIATCGHEISLDWFLCKESVINTKDYAREGGNAVSQIVVCPDCRKFYAKHRLILKDRKSELKWMRSGKSHG